MEVAHKPPKGKSKFECFTEDGNTAWLTDVNGDQMIDFIERHKNKPFFMYWSPEAVHSSHKETPKRLSSRTTAKGKRALLGGGGNVAAVANNHVYVMALRASLNADQQRLAAAPLTQLFTGNGGGLGLAAICLAGAAEYAMNGVLEQVSGRPRGQDYLRYAAQGLERWKRAAADPEPLRRFDPVAPQEDAQFQAHWAASELLAAALEGLLQNPSPDGKPYRAAQAALRKSETAAKAYWDVVLKGAGPNTVAQARQ